MRTLMIALSLVGFTTACGSKDEAPKAGVSEQALTEAKTVFSQRCATCHGQQGKGDGPAGAALNPKPRSFGEAGWQAKVTDEHLAKVIVGGGQSVGLSPMMAPNPDLKDKPEVVKGLVQLVREMGK
ncbi:MAG: c-type cytochrome [Myxococcales bacterium]|nr:c-type cytochrome [Myxococcales bacterium]MCB9547662.1 c-type cytochrome [Myxococcales bacterium]